MSEVSLTAWREFLVANAGGGVLNGQVTQVMPFGAFVEVADGIVGLLPKQALPGDVELGSQVSVKIENVDLEGRRFSLTLA
jgi:small subunit ribosomal protein S1